MDVLKEFKEKRKPLHGWFVVELMRSPLNTKSKTQKKYDAWCNGINSFKCLMTFKCIINGSISKF